MTSKEIADQYPEIYTQISSDFGECSEDEVLDIMLKCIEIENSEPEIIGKRFI